uniref:Uncharacterized protein n=1 Tax=Anguilla anguilla TaxID=7936 RepID=A0A0E9WSX3_ANGAN
MHHASDVNPAWVPASERSGQEHNYFQSKGLRTSSDMQSRVTLPNE